MIDSIMLWLSNWGAAIPLFCVLISRDKKTILKGILALLLTWGVSASIKEIIARPRPFIAGDAQLIGSAPDGFSFPSIHSSLSFSMAMIAWLKHNVLGIVAGVFAALVAYSRVYLGVHYWSDILAGAVLGIVIAFAVGKGVDHFERSNRKAKRKKQ